MSGDGEDAALTLVPDAEYEAATTFVERGIAPGRKVEPLRDTSADT